MTLANTVGFFTVGVPAERYDLPHPRLGLHVILLIRRVLLRAFELLREEGFDLAAATEDQVTAALRSTIENRLRQTGEVKGFTKLTFEFMVRQGQWQNHNFAVLTKTPDLFFKLRDDNSKRAGVLSEFDGLFIEAKPVDSTHPVGSKYCDDGLIRFVRGDYAWAMQEAMMLAYVRDNRSISGHLVPAMNIAARVTSLATLNLPQACRPIEGPACSEAESVYISHHRRNFQWPDGKGPASELTVYHLWHRCSA